LYVDVPVIDSIDKTNNNQIARATKMIHKYWNKKLAFLGLSFKEGTDDLRNSPAVRVIESLLGKGADITIYDKNVNTTMLTGTNKDYIDARIPHLSKLLSSDLDSVIENSDVLIVNTREKEFIEKLKSVKDKIIIDFVRLGDEFLHLKNYTGINWSRSLDGGTYISNEDTVLVK